ncbi:MAG: glycoside hydrolase family 2 TIM barrel-domain containing protein [Faecousia sp.]
MQKIYFCDNWKLNGKPVTIPHDAMLSSPRRADSPAKSASAYFTGGTYRYTKKFTVPSQWAEKTVSLYFEGIYRNSQVYLNGTAVGGCKYGYTDFTICLDGQMKYGEENELVVVADNSQMPNTRWYSGSGMYRPVSLLLGAKSHIHWQGVQITTLSIKPAEILVETAHTGGEIQLEILEGETVVARGTGDFCKITIPNAKLWSEESPDLYTCRVTLLENGAEVETINESFGIRNIFWSNKGLFINGKEVLLRGGCVHHDNGVLGAATFAKSEWRRVKKMKEAGFNAIRSSHNPCSKEMLQAADFYGMYIMDELWDMWYKPKNLHDYAIDFPEHYPRDIEAMVRKDYNHPSVIMYSIGNEVTEPAKPKGVEQAREIVTRLKALDTTRPVTAGLNLAILQGEAMNMMGTPSENKAGECNQEKTVNNASQQFNNLMNGFMGKGMNYAGRLPIIDHTASPVLAELDICGYNYCSGRYKLERKAHPERILVGSETFPGDIAKNWKLVKELPYLIGDFMWTGWDYLGEAGIGAWSYEKEVSKGSEKPYPWLLGGSGAIDILGNPNGEMLLAAAVWKKLKAPAIAVRPVNHAGEVPQKTMWRSTDSIPSWSWQGCRGKWAQVEVYFHAPLIELRLNGKMIARHWTKGCCAKFILPYQPGKLTAIALDVNKKELCRSELRSAHDVHLTLKPEEESVAIGDIVYVNAEISDDAGIVESNADRTVTISVVGGKLLGFGSACPSTKESYLTGIFTTYQGRAQAVILAEDPGEITVTATDGKEIASTVIHSI